MGSLSSGLVAQAASATPAIAMIAAFNEAHIRRLPVCICPNRDAAAPRAQVALLHTRWFVR
jgi:hypothetical protein